MITQPPNNTKSIAINKKEQIFNQTSLRKCEEITNKISGKIQEQIINGQVKVRKKPLHIYSNDNIDRITQNPEKSIRDKISLLGSDLQMLQKQISMQKEKQREKQEQKKREASQLIDRLKRQKQEYQNRLRFNQMSSRLKISLLSEEVLKQMRERRESLILQKKKDMQLRVYKIINRRTQRQEDQNRNQISYWTRIKQLQQKKRHQSTKILPSIHKYNEEPQFGINIQRKNSNFSNKRSFSKQDLTIQYHDVVNKFLQRAKSKQTQSKSQQTHNYKSLTINNEAIQEKNQCQLVNFKTSEVKNQKMEKVVASFLQDKRKMLGNQYLKQSILKVDRAKSPRASPILDYSFVQQSLELKGSPVFFHKNDKVSYLQDRRQKILQSLSNNRIQKSLAIQMLGPVQSRLDKLNPEGIQKRLKQKLQIFEQVQKKNQQVQKYKPITQFQQSKI